MDLIKISAVSYLNTYPFVYGVMASGLLQNYSLELDVPSICAEKLKSGKTDIALVPSGALPEIRKFHHLSDFCIGATTKVRTVLLLSQVPLEQITRIQLDFDSRTSVKLIQVLAREYWKITPQWERLEPGQAAHAGCYESLVAIGDKTFHLRDHYHYVYDLAEAWISFTGLPFVFAVWISGKPLPEAMAKPFNKALEYGINRKAECLEYFRDRLPEGVDCLAYLEDNISYEFDERKRSGLEKFLSLLKHG